MSFISSVSHAFLSGQLFKATPLLLRRGKPRPRAGMFPDKYRRVPTLLKPQQGGQQFFNDFLLRQANDEAKRRFLQGDDLTYVGARGGGGKENALKRGDGVGDGSVDGRLGGGVGGADDIEGEVFRFADGGGEDTAALLAPRLPQMDFQNALEGATDRSIEEEIRQLRARDKFDPSVPRSFNERKWYEEEKTRLQDAYHQKQTAQRAEDSRRTSTSPDLSPSRSSSMLTAPCSEEKEMGELDDEEHSNAASSSSSLSSSSPALPERILSDDYFHQRYGFSLIRRARQVYPDTSTTSLPPHLQGHPDAALEHAVQNGSAGNSGGGGYPGINHTGGMTAYSQLDLWAELPRYHREMIFLYLISRRRNTYAVAYDYDGKRFLHPYTAGNRGLKGGDRGFRGDGSTDNGHQVTSAYLNDLIPKIRERRAELGLVPLQRGDKVELVVRVMGFYNGRQGAVRAVQDRSAEFTVRYLEDITPFPLNGPKMPRGVFR